jgi:hypothetical protein
MQITPSLLGSLLALLISQQSVVRATRSQRRGEVGEVVQGDYFSEEAFQLTNDSLSALDDIDAAHASLFYPENTSQRRNVASYSSRKCKTFPGDSLWPSTTVWRLFDWVTGGALIKTVPIAASCYDDYETYDKSLCNHVVDQWTNSSLQSVNPHHDQTR